MRFNDAMPLIIEFEGGYGNDPRDPGGETNFGISKRAYPNEDVKNLTLERAYEIYRRDYWDAVKADALPAPVRFSVFDMAINSGVRQAIRTLQKSVGVAQDGILGPNTMQAVWGADPQKLVLRFAGNRLHFLTSLNTFATFGRGWTKRVAENLLNT